MLHFFENPFEAERAGFDPAHDILIGPVMPPEMRTQRLEKALKELPLLREEDLLALDRRAEEIYKDWETIKRLW